MTSPTEMTGSSAEDEITLEFLREEVVRLNKIISVLVDRAERSASMPGSDFGIFQTTILLEEQVKRRTIELEAALRENETITNALRKSEARFRGLVSQSLVGITIIERGVITYANDTFGNIFGWLPEDVLRRDPFDVISVRDNEIVRSQFNRCILREIQNINCTVRGVGRNHDPIDVEIHGNAMDVGGERALICLFIDVSERVRAEQKIRALQQELLEQSVRDALTGLYNRRYFEEQVTSQLSRAERLRTSMAFLIGDIDHFKSVNDNYGHIAGDVVLKDFAAVLSENLIGTGAVICRFGGEEFIAMLPDADRQAAYQHAEAIRTALHLFPFKAGGTAISVTASFGIATFPDDGTTRDELVLKADRALYDAKEEGRDRVRCAKA